MIEGSTQGNSTKREKRMERVLLKVEVKATYSQGYSEKTSLMDTVSKFGTSHFCLG